MVKEVQLWYYITILAYHLHTLAMNIPWCLLPKKVQDWEQQHQWDAQLYKACCLVIHQEVEACDYTKVQTQPVAIQAGGLDQTIHPQDLEEFSRWISLKYQKKWHMFGIGNFFQELQRQRAMAEAYWGLLCTIASWSWLFSLCLAVPHVKTVKAWDLQEILARIAASIARAGRRLLLAGLGMSWVILWALRRLPWSSKQESRSHVACCSTFWFFFRHFRVFREN